MRISDCSSDVCSSDLGFAGQFDRPAIVRRRRGRGLRLGLLDEHAAVGPVPGGNLVPPPELARDAPRLDVAHPLEVGLLPVLRHEHGLAGLDRLDRRSEEHTSELQSLMRISYAVFCLKKTKINAVI